MKELLTDREQTALIVLLGKACVLDKPAHSDPSDHANLDPPDFKLPGNVNDPFQWRNMIFTCLGHQLARDQAKALHARAHRAV